VKTLSNGMRSLEILAIIPESSVRSSDGSKGSLSLEPEDVREEALWRDVGQELGRDGWLGTNVPYAFMAGMMGSEVEGR